MFDGQVQAFNEISFSQGPRRRDLDLQNASAGSGTRWAGSRAAPPSNRVSRRARAMPAARPPARGPGGRGRIQWTGRPLVGGRPIRRRLRRRPAETGRPGAGPRISSRHITSIGRRPPKIGSWARRQQPSGRAAARKDRRRCRGLLEQTEDCAARRRSARPWSSDSAPRAVRPSSSAESRKRAGRAGMRSCASSSAQAALTRRKAAKAGPGDMAARRADADFITARSLPLPHRARQPRGAPTARSFIYLNTNSRGGDLVHIAGEPYIPVTWVASGRPWPTLTRAARQAAVGALLRADEDLGAGLQHGPCRRAGR